MCAFTPDTEVYRIDRRMLQPDAVEPLIASLSSRSALPALCSTIPSISDVILLAQLTLRVASLSEANSLKVAEYCQ
jgi:hypothetical protein